MVDTAKEGPDLVVVMAAILAVASVLSAGLLLKIRRRRSQIKLYDQVEPSALPPTLDIIRSLGHDREAEFTEGSLQNSKAYKRSTTVSVQSTEDLVMMRKSYWPAVKDGCASNPIHIFNDVELDDEVIRPPRKTYWPNDAQFDASNPSYVFDDISVRSEALDSSSRSNSSGSDYNESVSDGSDEHKTIV